MADSLPLRLLGTALQRLRQERDLTLEELAKRSDVSTGMLSQIERGLGNPSVLTLHKIAQAMQVPMSYFLAGVDRGDGVVHPNSRKRLTLPSSASLKTADLVYELLCPDLTGSLEMLWIEYGAGASTEEAPFVHQGEECGLVLRGRLEVHTGDQVYSLAAGDSVYLSSSIPHWFRNPDAEKDAILVWAITPPSF